MLLLAALAAVGLVGSDPDRIAGAHGILTWNHMAVAANLSPAHGWLGFYRRVRDAEGVHYEPYNRFPVLGHLLIKLAAAPFATDAARLQAARALMLAFFGAAALAAWLAVWRLADDAWIALAAVLLAFSSFQALYYADMVATEGVIDLFAVMLAFHGAAVFATAGRFGQLVAKSCLALALGWHALALIGPLAALGLLTAWRRRDWPAARRHFTLGAVAVLFAAAMLGFNLAREHAALGGATPVAELPTVASMISRTGIKPKHVFSWETFAQRQLNRVALAATPYAASRAGVHIRQTPQGRHHGTTGLVLGAVALALGFGAVAVLGRGLRGVAFAALAATGPCWAIAVRHSTNRLAHEFEGLFHIGLPLAFFALTLPKVAHAIGSRRGAPILASIAAAAFTLSLALMARDVHNPAKAQASREMQARFDAIRAIVAGKTVLPADDGNWRNNPRARLLLRGAVIVDSFDDRHLADFAVGRPLEHGVSLTPSHDPRFFLYDAHTQDAALKRVEAQVARQAPALSALRCDVHLLRNSNVDDDLAYVCRDCPAVEHVEEAPAFFVHVYPQDDDAVPPGAAFDNRDFRPNWWRANGRCYALKRLPGYAIAEIHTGEFISAPGASGRFQNLWEGRLVVDGASGPGFDALLAGGTLAAQTADWEVRVLDDRNDGRELLYVRHACPDAARFRDEPHVFLHVYPQDADVLGRQRRKAGFDNLDFAPARRLARHDGKCYGVRRLPDYDIAQVRTGQFAAEVLWSVDFTP